MAELVVLGVRLVLEIVVPVIILAATEHQKETQQQRKRQPKPVARRRRAAPVPSPLANVAPATQIDTIFHSVKPTDTLAGLSIMYDTPMADIRRANNLWGDQIQHLQLLLIPLPKLEAKKITDEQEAPAVSSEPSPSMPESEKVDA